MSTIEQSVNDTPKTIEDKVRALPANQGINEKEMWDLIDAEVAQSTSDNKIINNQFYVPENIHD